jgi:hypothetical protein
MQCPHCGSRTFDVGGPIMIWNQQTIRFIDSLGNYVLEHEELGDTIETHDWEDARCADCNQGIAVGMLFSITLPQYDEAGTA